MTTVPAKGAPAAPLRSLSLTLLTLTLLLLLLLTAPRGGCAQEARAVEILEMDNEPFVGGDSWKWGFVSGDGTARRERGRVLADGGVEVEGAYRYRAPDGSLQEVAYTAGRDGYRPRSPRRVCADAPDDELCLSSVKSLVGLRRRRKTTFIRVYL